MTNGEARTSEIEMKVFQMNSEQDGRQANSVEDEVETHKFDKPTKMLDIRSRFARLKKSLRKRSVSIL